MHRPIFWISIAFALGIVTSYYLQINDYALLFLAFTILLYVARTINRPKKLAFSILLLIYTISIIFTQPHYSSKLEIYKDQKAFYTARIIKVEPKEEYTKYTLKTQTVNDRKIKEKVVAFMPSGTDDYKLYELLEFYATVLEPKSNTNPLLFNYKRHLLSNGIVYTIKIENPKVLPSINSFTQKIRKSTLDYIDKTLNDNLTAEQVGLMKGLIIGDSGSLDEDSQKAYRQLGLAHILAVSGFHIGLLSAVILLALSLVGLKRSISLLITILLLWIYGYIVGFPPSTLRALIMFSVVSLGLSLHKPIDFLNLWGTAFLIALMINPLWLFNVGFQLSYGSIFGIGILGKRVKDLFYPLKGNIIGTISLIIAINICILPFQLFYFNQLPLISVISNLIVVPVVSINVILGFLALLFSKAFYLLRLGLMILQELVNTINLIPLKAITVKTPSFFELSTYIVLIAMLLYRENLRFIDKKVMKSIFIGSLVFIVATVWVQTDKQIEIHFIDVGQSDAALIRKGRKAILIDAGGSLYNDDQIGERIVLPYLIKHGVKELEAAIITHNHADHFGGYNALIGKVRIAQIFYNGSKLDPNIEQLAKSNGISTTKLYQGDSYRSSSLGDFEVLWPKKDWHSRNENDLSLVTEHNINGLRILFTGDIEEVAELALEDKLQEISILKVPHHGSLTSSSKDFIRRLNPKNAIISVGKNNSFGHPNNEVLENYINIGANVFRTDEQGMIKVILTNTTYKVIPFGGNLFRRNLFDAIELLYVLLKATLYLMIFTKLIILYMNSKEKYYEL